jgi:glucose-1-phosphate adenylyltransferase
MLDHHKKCDADVTIAVRPVEWKEASRFGIMSTDESGRITEFEEKPKEPKSNLASMGIYIFNWKLLRAMLVADDKNEDSDHDFGKDIIPTLLKDEKRLFAYEFADYWKDVGTVDSLWEANMDLLSDRNDLDLNDKNWKIYTEDVATIPHYVGPAGKVNNAYINQGCLIDGTVNNSVLFTNVTIAEGAEVNDAVLLPNVEVGEGAVINRAIIAEGVKIAAGAVVGDANSEEIALISKNVK